jgi:hypothetical protein
MNIGMKKIKEDDIYVFYQFDDDVTGKKYINDRGQERFVVETKVGYCRFNKETEEFILLENTDPFFLEPNKRQVLAVMFKLIKIKRAGEKFPESTGIATG